MPRKTLSADLPDSRYHWIAVLGAAKRFDDRQLKLGYQLGKTVALSGKGLITGATTGIPLAAAVGAKDHGGQVLGISPAENPSEHTRHFAKPLHFHDIILYTGLGNDGRSPMIVRSAGIALFAGGEAGTLQEFSAAWLNGIPVIGILEKSGGISDQLMEIASSFKTRFGSRLVASDQPKFLVQKCLNELDTQIRDADLDHPEPDPATLAVLKSLATLRPKDDSSV